MSDEGTTREARLRQGSAQRRAERRHDLRRAILDAATELFERDGYERFSLRQVAEVIGYSPPAIYLHFADKDDLLHHVALEGFRSFGEELQRAYDGTTEPRGRLRAIGKAYLDFGMTHRVHYRLMFMVRGEFLERPAPAGYESIIDSFGILERAVREAMEQGALRPGPVEAHSTFLWAMVHGLVSLHLATPYFPRETVEALFPQHMEVAMAGMRS